MKDKFILYDPITLKEFHIDFNQLRFWIDGETLSEQLKLDIEKKEKFNELTDQAKGELVNLLEDYKSVMPYSAKEVKWGNIPGLDINMELFIDYIPDNEVFFDKVGYNTETKLFHKNDLNKFMTYAHLEIEDKINMTAPAVLLLKDNFISYKDLSPIEKLPIFNHYKGPESDKIKRIILDKDSNIQPIRFQIPVFVKKSWVIYLGVNIRTKLTPDGVLWNRIIKNKALYDFFHQIGYKPKGDGKTRTIWVNEEEGNIIEFNESPYHKNFMLIKQANFRNDPYSRRRLGDALLEKMNEKNVYEKNCFNSGNLHLKDALDSFQIQNKHKILNHLKYAKEDYKSCNNVLKYQGITELVFVYWLEGLVADKVGDFLYRDSAYIHILELMVKNKNWDFISWFLNDLEQSKIYNVDFVRSLPLNDHIERNFLEDYNFELILDYWLKCYKKDQYNPKNTVNSLNDYLYKYFNEAYIYGYPKIAKKLFSKILNNTIKTKTDIFWLLADNDLDLLNISREYGLIKDFISSIVVGIKQSEYLKTQITFDADRDIEKKYKLEMLKNILKQLKLINQLILVLNNIGDETSLSMYTNNINELMENFELFYDKKNNYSDIIQEEILGTLTKTYKVFRHIGNKNMIDTVKTKLSSTFSEYMNFNNFEICQTVFNREEKEKMVENLFEIIDASQTNEIEKAYQKAYIYISLGELEKAEENILFIIKTDYADDNFEFFKKIKMVNSFFYKIKDEYDYIDPRITAFINRQENGFKSKKSQMMNYNNSLIKRISKSIELS